MTISKSQSLKDPSHYHPISHINSTLKILSKILAIRLGCKIDELINTTQSAFIKGRYIIDNIVIAQDLIYYMQKNHLPGLILKVYFSKAFDTVEWSFLFDLLRAWGLVIGG